MSSPPIYENAAGFKSPIKNYWDRELEFFKVLKTMESRGVLLDQAFCRRERAIGEDRMFHLQNEMFDYKPTSSKSMIALFERAGVPLLEDHKTEKGNYSFDKEAMEDYDRMLESRADKFSDLAVKILEYRGWFKTISSNYTSYLNHVSPDGRLRCNYNQGGTKTGRCSCNDPNLQQIPRSTSKRWNGGLKKAFVAKPGFVLVSNDYSQLEFRLGAAYSKQENLLELFNKSRHPELWTKEERDVFTRMSIELGRDRQDCKTLTYTKSFGGGKLKIALFLGEDVPQEVRTYTDFKYKEQNPVAYRSAWQFLDGLSSSQFIREWESTYNDMHRYSKWVNDVAKQRGVIRNWAGRPRHVTKYDSRKAFNSLIQGGGAEIVKSAMIRLFKEVDNPDCQMLLQVHDSVVFEIRESKVDYYIPIIKEVMSNVEAEKDFGVFFATEEEFWGLTA